MARALISHARRADTHLLVQLNTNSATSHVVDDARLAVVVLVGHALLLGRVGHDVNVVANLRSGKGGKRASTCRMPRSTVADADGTLSTPRGQQRSSEHTCKRFVESRTFRGCKY